jgi:peptidoglycan/LPS O-acetylase OafA/YrhL
MTKPAAGDHKWLALDAVRALAALSVIAAHVRGASWVEYGALAASDRNLAVAAFFAITRVGHEAVMVFFVLSGLLVGGPLIERSMSGAFRIGDYALDRCVRIFLPLVPVCLLTVAINFAVFDLTAPLHQVLLNMIGLNGVLVPTLPNNGPLWSLAYEIWFYVLGGALAVAVTRRHPLAFTAVFAAVLVFSVLKAAYLLFWAVGAVMFFALRSRRGALLAAVGGVGAVTGVILMQLASGSKSFVSIGLQPQFAEAVLCIGFALCLPAFCGARATRALIPIAPTVRFASAVSYTVYLVHYPVNAALGTIMSRSAVFDAGAIGFFLARLAVCVAVALAFWWLFERNTDRVKKLLRSQLRPGRKAEVYEGNRS